MIVLRIIPTQQIDTVEHDAKNLGLGSAEALARVSHYSFRRLLTAHDENDTIYHRR